MPNTQEWFKSGFGKIVAYFLQGLLLIAPSLVTLWAIYYFFDFFDSRINDLFERVFHFHFPGFGLVIVFLLITLIGFIGSMVIVQPILRILDLILEKTPLVKDIYSALKDFFGAFKLGFITQNDLNDLHIKDKVAIYTPLSYNLSGILYLVNADQVQPLENVSSSLVLKFIVSGGVTEIDEEAHHHYHHTAPGKPTRRPV